jgi:succinate dehydrogenase (ubiquinone) cytochrome b560 subunit
VGVPVDSAHIVDLAAGLPEWFKYATKGAVGMAFSFHSWNGVRHLLWDAGKCESFPQSLSSKLTDVLQ